MHAVQATGVQREDAALKCSASQLGSFCDVTWWFSQTGGVPCSIQAFHQLRLGSMVEGQDGPTSSGTCSLSPPLTGTSSTGGDGNQSPTWRRDSVAACTTRSQPYLFSWLRFGPVCLGSLWRCLDYRGIPSSCSAGCWRSWPGRPHWLLLLKARTRTKCQVSASSQRHTHSQLHLFHKNVANVGAIHKKKMLYQAEH